METKERIKTNIVELSKLYRMPCDEWLERFVDGKLDAHEAFKEFGEKYEWLYNNSPYDLIGWEIEKGVFDWERYSWLVAKFCPEHFDKEKFNWKKHSWLVAKYCSHLIDKEKYNWDIDSWAVARFCPEHFDKEKYNWYVDSKWVAKYCPQYIDKERYNWEKDEWAVAEYCPEYLKLNQKIINYEKEIIKLIINYLCKLRDFRFH